MKKTDIDELVEEYSDYSVVSLESFNATEDKDVCFSEKSMENRVAVLKELKNTKFIVMNKWTCHVFLSGIILNDEFAFLDFLSIMNDISKGRKKAFRVFGVLVIVNCDMKNSDIFVKMEDGTARNLKLVSKDV